MTIQTSINRLVLCVVSGRQAGELMHQLSQNHFYFTRIDSLGGVIEEPTVTLMVGVQHTRLDSLLSLVSEYCQPFEEYIPVQINMHGGGLPMPMIEAQVGGALIYIFEVEQFEQI